MSNRYKDFDQFFAEMEPAQKREPVSFVYGGQKYVAADDLPAGLALRMMRLNRQGPDQLLADEEIVEIIAGVLGKEQTDKLLESGISFPRLDKLLQWLFQQYGGGSQEADDEPGNAAEAPAAT